MAAIGKNMDKARFTEAVRERICKLACDGVNVRAIADRLGLTYDRVRRMIERAEERGDVPSGTLSKCGVMKAKVTKLGFAPKD